MGFRVLDAVAVGVPQKTKFIVVVGVNFFKIRKYYTIKDFYIPAEPVPACWKNLPPVGATWWHTPPRHTPAVVEKLKNAKTDNFVNKLSDPYTRIGTYSRRLRPPCLPQTGAWVHPVEPRGLTPGEIAILQGLSPWGLPQMPRGQLVRWIAQQQPGTALEAIKKDVINDLS